MVNNIMMDQNKMKENVKKLETEIKLLKDSQAKSESKEAKISSLQKQTEINAKLCKERETCCQQNCDEIRQKLGTSYKFIEELKQTLPVIIEKLSSDISKLDKQCKYINSTTVY